MGSVVDSLKRLYKKIGGGKVKGPIAIDDLVDKIADQMSSGGSSGSGASSNNGGTLLIVLSNFDNDTYTLNKTYAEIATMFNDHNPVGLVAVYTNGSIGFVSGIHEEDGTYHVAVINQDVDSHQYIDYICDSQTDYPIFREMEL